MNRIEVANIINDEYQCFCPYHDDNVASLYINLKKNKAHCFAECFGGSAVRFISEYFDISRIKAQELILQGKIFNYSHAKITKSSSCYKYQDNMLEWESCSKLKYLLDRGFYSSTILFWDIEYNDIIRHIRIPTKNSDGDILLGYVYRTIDNLVPKYITPGWSKKENWFGIHMFQQFNSTVNIVEGALDAIWMWQNNLRNTLALLGTPRCLSEQQINILKNLGIKRLRLCLDNDFAGMQARIRYQNQLRDMFDIKYIEVPKEDNKKDVQDLSHRELWETIIKNDGR